MTSSLLGARRGAQVPRVANFPPHPDTEAEDAILLAESCGLVLDEWQRYVLRHGLGCQPDGTWTASRVSTWVPRQNGKGAIIEALELYWLFVSQEKLVVHSAHQHRTSQQAYDRLESLIRSNPELCRLVRNFRQANGEQAIELVGGRSLQYHTRSRSALRGFSAPKLVLDEAQELTAEQMAAVMPTLSAQRNWQAWFFGTPPSSPTAWAYNLREDGEAGVSRLAYFDWGAEYLDMQTPEGRARALDQDLWYACNPALGDRIELETVEDESLPSGLGDLFPQERLGVWQPRATGGSGVIPEELWQALRDDRRADPHSVIRPADVVLVAQVNASRSHTTIVAVGVRPDGTILASIVDHRAGTHWVVERLAALKARRNPLCIVAQDKGPTGTLLDDLAAAGITPPEDRDKPARGDLVVPWAADVAIAYGLLIDAVTQKRLRHLDEAPLNVAVATGKTRNLNGGTAWDYADPAAAPLIAVTLGVWAALTVKLAPRRRSAYEDDDLVVV